MLISAVLLKIDWLVAKLPGIWTWWLSVAETGNINLYSTGGLLIEFMAVGKLLGTSKLGPCHGLTGEPFDLLLKLEKKRLP